MTTKACFLLRIAPQHREEYIARHEQLWPEMVVALRESGYRNYSIFMDPSGLLIGYFESDDVEATARAMRDHPVNERWNRYMNWMFLPVDDHSDEDHFLLPRVFDLDDQTSLKESIHT